VSGDTIIVGAHNEDSSATGVNGDGNNDSLENSGAAYVFVRDNGGNWTQQAYLKASNTGGLDFFGVSVAISGDTAVVAAHQEDSAAIGVNGDQTDNSAGDSGAVYVFARDPSGNWSQQAYLKASNTNAQDFFGESLSISGNTLLVGASREDSDATGINGDASNNSANGSGAAYVFVRDSANLWSQKAYVKASNTESPDTFGGAVSISGSTMVVGAIREQSAATGLNGDQLDNSAAQAGAVYIYR
jgi:hypothetical protein